MMSDWTRDDAFWAVAAPHLFSPEHWAVAPAEALEVLALLRLQPGARVLDLGCGTGRHALALAELGYDVTAVDGAQEYLREVRRRARAAGLELEIEHADLRSYRAALPVDGACCLGSTFGLFKNDADNRQVATRLLEALRPGAAAVIEVIGREMLPSGFSESEVVRDESRSWTIRRSLDHEGWMEDVWDDGSGERYRTGYRVYSAPALRELLIESGFARVELAGGLDGSPYDEDAFRLVAIAWR